MAKTQRINLSLLAIMFCSSLLLSTSHAETKAPTLEPLVKVIQASEADYTDIVEGAEKHIRWYQGQPIKRDIAFVYIHGFSASRQELSPVTELLADRFSANVFYTRLTGHGRSDDAMAEASVLAWKKDIQDAYDIGRIIGKKVILISTSTGGTLATWLLAKEDTKQPFVNIMISPNFEVQNPNAWLLKSSLGTWLAKKINGDYHSFTPLSEAHGKYWTERYPLDAVTPMMQLLDEVDDIDKSTISAPQLIVYSPNDKVINTEKISQLHNEFSSSDTRLHPFTQSTDSYQHVLAGVACSPESTDEMVNVLTDYLNELIQ